METAKFLTRPDGARLHYRLWRGGEGRPLAVLLHGMASNLTRWSEFVQHTRLKDRYDLLRVDLRGHGESFTHNKIGMKLWCQDLNAILDAENYPSALWIGHSLGANVALNMAAASPARVSGLALIDPTFTEALQGTALRIRRTVYFWKPLIATIRLLNRLGLYRRHVPNRDMYRLDQDVRQRLLGAGKDADFVKRYTSPLADIEHFGTANYLQEVLEITQPIPPMPENDIPMLVLISQAVTFTDTGKTLASLACYPKAQVVTLSAYHWPLTEKPVEVRETIDTWGLNLL